MSPGKPVHMVAKIWPTQAQYMAIELPGKSFNWAANSHVFTDNTLFAVID